MALSDISLTSGMRSNLLSLQNTSELLDRTQNRLATGKKVNTAIDNPVSFFAAQALSSRASKIDSLKDSMGQSIQTITAADKGITAINSMIEQAKAVGQQALSADNAEGTDGVSFVVTASSLSTADTIAIGGLTLTAGTDFDIATGSTADADTAAAIVAAINASSTLSSAGYTASIDTKDNNNVIIRKEWTDLTTSSITASGNFGAETKVDKKDTELTNLQEQYNELRTQITKLAEDSGYKGKNLLSDDDLAVKFEGNKLTVEGFDASATGLGISEVANSMEWRLNGTTAMESSLDELDEALDTLAMNSSKLSSNLSIITTREDFSTNMVNTLTEGSDKLTLADTNEEGANMLMLQTRQSLATTALSLSAQAAQSVLKLF
ncbi:MAG: flagellin [Syntrophus sp. PtaU1.Bin208]|nr:MAG: flagellin [Syntrophus sp. PtaU1.Bin208]